MSTEPSVPVSYYIYYRVRATAEREDAHATVRAMQTALAQRTGVQGRLLERCGEDVTWMEIYENVRDTVAFEIALREETAIKDLEALIEPGSARHIERFTECA
ncbi:MAG TPA: DUF4936 family protein [Aromatoleum sp.]|uniref:DUF4936 family protein n=1 Tax=Aromatoleum sp. TaxID=2307007 RepID=UPI002B465DD1|nr:DUF4936 family protein [Aromatoleum sp.]HJV24112.1 DUF4936 family protein [Aromatoleum sp.]